MSRPFISVVIPLYNKGEYVQEAIESALLQQELLEVIVVDDGSTDSGPAIVNAISDSRIRLIRQANGGVSAARNKGIDESSGDFIAFLDADDRYLDGFLSTISNMIRDWPGAGIYATAYKRILADGTVITQKPLGISDSDKSLLLTDFFASWSKSSLFFTSSICISRTALNEKKIRFPEGESLGEDQDVWFRLAEEYPVVYCPRPLSVYNMGVQDSLTSREESISLLPSYLRLAERVESGQFPKQLIHGAQKLISSHYLNVARVRLAKGDRFGSAQIIFNRKATCNFYYWLRTLIKYLIAVMNAPQGS